MQELKRVRTRSSERVKRHRTADLVRHDDEVLAGRAVGPWDERDALRSQVARGSRRPTVHPDRAFRDGVLDIGDEEVAVVEILDERRAVGGGDVEDHNAAHALQSDEGVRGGADSADGNGLGLRTFGVAAAIEAVVLVVIRIEIIRNGGRDALLDVVAAVEAQGAGRSIPCREAPRAERVQFVVHGGSNQLAANLAGRVALGVDVPVVRKVIARARGVEGRAEVIVCVGAVWILAFRWIPHPGDRDRAIGVHRKAAVVGVRVVVRPDDAKRDRGRVSPGGLPVDVENGDVVIGVVGERLTVDDLPKVEPFDREPIGDAVGGIVTHVDRREALTVARPRGVADALIGVEARRDALRRRGFVDAEGVRDLQSPELIGILEGRVGEDGRVQDELGHARLFEVPGVSFVGRHEHRFRPDRRCDDGVGLIHAEDGPGLNIDGTVLVAGVETVAHHAVVFVAERHDTHGFGREVHDRERVVLLEGDVGRAVGRRGELRLQVFGNRWRRIVRCADDADAVRNARESAERDRGDPERRGVNEADGAFRIDAVVRLAFVGDDEGAAVGRKGDPVGQRADLHDINCGCGDVCEIRCEVDEHDHAEVGLRIGLDGHGEQIARGGHAVRSPRGEGRGSVGLREGVDVDRGEERRRGRRVEIQHVDGAGIGVDEEDAVPCGIEGGDFGRPFVEDVGFVGAKKAEGRVLLGERRRRTDREHDQHHPDAVEQSVGMEVVRHRDTGLDVWKRNEGRVVGPGGRALTAKGRPDRTRKGVGVWMQGTVRHSPTVT